MKTTMAAVMLPGSTISCIPQCNKIMHYILIFHPKRNTGSANEN